MAPTSYPLPSMPADLDSLKEFASVQNQRIQKLLEREAGAMPRHFTVSPQQGWKAVWKATWGLGNGIFEGNEEVVRDSDSDAIDNSLLPDPIPSHCNIATKPPGLDAAWRFACKKLFVRAEYDVAQAAAVQLCGYNEGSYPFDVLVFSGQSGIGKSIFLFLLLLRRLAAGLPTGLQIHPECALLFYEDGVLEFGRLNDDASYSSLEDVSNPHSRIWMLADSNQHLTQPTGAFVECGPFFVVLAASPGSDRIKWTNKTKRYHFYMKPWSFSEYIQARNHVVPRCPPSEQVLWDLYTKYAPSPRDLFHYWDVPSIYMADLIQEIGRVTPATLSHLLLSADMVSDTSHRLVLIEPSPISRYVPQRRVVTSHVFSLFWDRHIYNQAREMARFYDLFSNPSFASGTIVSEMIFGVRIHQLLKKGRHLILTPIRGRLADGDVVYDDYRTTIMPSNRHVQLGPLAEVPLTDGITLNPGYYYHPQIPNFPTIDSLILYPPVDGKPPVLVIFQITCTAEERAVKEVGLEKINQLVIPKNAEKFLVIVTPEDVKPKITVPRTYLTDAFLANRTPDTAFPVFHLQVTRGALF